MYKNDDYLNFKCMLECFVFRLRSANLQATNGNKFTQGMNKNIEGYAVYKKYWDGKGGNGHASGNPLFQAATDPWNLSSTGNNGQMLRMAIKQSQKIKNYTDRANFVYWLKSTLSTVGGVQKDISVNICAKWDNNQNVVGLTLYYSWDNAAKQEDTMTFSLNDLGLYDGESPNILLKKCLDFYTEMRDNVVLNKTFWEKKIEMVKLLVNNYNLILTGAPGTGKTFLARQIAASMIGCNVDDLMSKEYKDQFGFVQFHPSYDYTDFVEGLRPKKENNQVVFERQDGIFKEFCNRAAFSEESSEEKKIYVFVIDEINRGEISKIFGELFFSIDPGYRAPADRVCVKTQYQKMVDENEELNNSYKFKEGFYVPSNVYIIGTMNDIDRSVESMDFAFRRRFAFKEILAKDTQGDILDKFNDPALKDVAIKKMDAINNAIYSKGKGDKCNLLEGFTAAYHIGAAYFKKIEKYNGDWKQLWENHIKGVLYEYLRGTPDAPALLDKLEIIYNDAK